jgi:hypothetical protein
MTQADRRTFIAGVGATALVGLSGPAAASLMVAGFHMWHSPGCGCCLEWGRRIEALFQRRLRVIEVADMAAVKRANGVPADLQSCHTALIHSVAVEGHVPPADIRSLIQSGNSSRLGLAVPGMPAGSPGMDVGHSRRDPFNVYAFNNRGQRRIFASHGASRS